MSNPYKTPEFKILFEKWNQILKDEGHPEIEDFSQPDGPTLKLWSASKWNRPRSAAPIEERESIKRYYEMADELLKCFEFKNETHRRVWELHCEGKSVREIADVIRIRGFSKTRVQVIIVSIERLSGLKNG